MRPQKGLIYFLEMKLFVTEDSERVIDVTLNCCLCVAMFPHQSVLFVPLDVAGVHLPQVQLCVLLILTHLGAGDEDAVAALVFVEGCTSGIAAPALEGYCVQGHS